MSAAGTAEELARTRQAYGRFVPHEFLHLMGIDDITSVRIGDHVERPMTILFADIAGFTTISEQMGPAEIFGMLNSYLGEMEPIVRAHHGFVDKFIGDAIMALFPRQADDASEPVKAPSLVMPCAAERAPCACRCPP